MTQVLEQLGRSERRWLMVEQNWMRQETELVGTDFDDKRSNLEMGLVADDLAGMNRQKIGVGEMGLEGSLVLSQFSLDCGDILWLHLCGFPAREKS